MIEESGAAAGVARRAAPGWGRLRGRGGYLQMSLSGERDVGAPHYKAITFPTPTGLQFDGTRKFDHRDP